MNIPMPKQPLYQGLLYIFAGVLLLLYRFGFIYTIMNIVMLFAAARLIFKGIKIAGIDKPITDLYKKVMKK